MQNSSQQLKSKTTSKTDYLDTLCTDAGLTAKCKIKVRSILGIEIEHELINNGKLAELLQGSFVVTEHTSDLNEYANYDGKCEYAGQKGYFEIKSTFSRIGAYQQRRNIDTLIMNNVQYSVLKKLNDEGNLVVIVMYYYFDNALLVIDFRGTNWVSSTSEVEDAEGEKTFYDFEDSAVIKRIDNVLPATFRPHIRTLQYKQIEQHTRLCTSDRCNVRKHKI